MNGKVSCPSYLLAEPEIKYFCYRSTSNNWIQLILSSIDKPLVSCLLIFPRQLNIPVSIPNNLSSTRKMTGNNEEKKKLGSHLGPGQGEMIWLAGMGREYILERKRSACLEHKTTGLGGGTNGQQDDLTCRANALCNKWQLHNRREKSATTFEKDRQWAELLLQCCWVRGADQGDGLPASSLLTQKRLPWSVLSLMRHQFFCLSRRSKGKGSHIHLFLSKVIQSHSINKLLKCIKK